MGKLIVTKGPFASPILSFLLPLLFCFVQAHAHAQSSSAQQKLDLVKQALIDLSLGSDIKLASSAYVDSNGVLHESSLLKSNTRIRGIRITEYLEEAGIPRAKVDADILPDDGCENTAPAVKRQATINAVIGNDSSANLRVGDHYLAELSLMLKQSLAQALANSGHWVVAPDPQFSSSYERFVSAQSAAKPRYRFDIVLAGRDPLEGVSNHGEIALHHLLKSGYDIFAWSASKVPNVNYVKPWPEQALDYHLVLSDQATNEILWRSEWPMAYPKVERGYGKSSLPVHFEQEIAVATENFVTVVTDSVSCQIGSYRLSPRVDNPRLGEINVGFIAGVSVGDQFLIVKDRALLNQALVANGLDDLALAEVISVSAHRAVLRWAAGSTLFGMSGTEDRVAMLF
jgi:hypothetical protein